jgi:hypothetical protein
MPHHVTLWYAVVGLGHKPVNVVENTLTAYHSTSTRTSPSPLPATGGHYLYRTFEHSYL